MSNQFAIDYEFAQKQDLDYILFQNNILFINNNYKINKNHYKIDEHPQGFCHNHQYHSDYNTNNYAMNRKDNNSNSNNVKGNIKSNDNNHPESKEVEETRVLIAESEEEILLLFKIYLESQGLHSVTVDDSNKVLDIFLKDKDKSNTYETIVLDTNLKGYYSGFDVVRKINNENPNQKIVMVTT